MLTITLWNYYSIPHFSDVKVKAQAVSVQWRTSFERVPNNYENAAGERTPIWLGKLLWNSFKRKRKVTWYFPFHRLEIVSLSVSYCCSSMSSCLCWMVSSLKRDINSFCFCNVWLSAFHIAGAWWLNFFQFSWEQRCCISVFVFFSLLPDIYVDLSSILIVGK